MVSQSRRHGRCTRPPHLGRATTVRDFGSRQRLAKARVGQYEVVIDLEQGKLIPQARFALTQCVDPASDRRDPLADVEVESVTVDGRIAPSTSASKPCVPLLRHTAPQ
jgi:hypothetical protein